MSSEDWLEDIQFHPIFSPPPSEQPTASTSTDVQTSSSLRRNLLAVRQTDLIVAVGKEIRILNLQEVAEKKQQDSSDVAYKVLKCSDIGFEVQQLCVNPPGTLLAVVGTHALVVLELPKQTYTASLEPNIDCRGGTVGASHLTGHSSPIVKVDWHPLGDSFSSLLVLTQDTILREYDVNVDVSTPQQTTSFLREPPANNSRRRGAFGIGSQSESTAVSFTFGRGQADWGPLTVYGLMANGDIWVICPYLPRNASITQAFIQALDMFLSEKAQRLRTALKPTTGASSLADSVQARAWAAGRLGTQQKWVRAISDQISQIKASRPREMDVDASTQKFSVKSPEKNAASAVARQGPLLMQPEPVPLEAEGELGVEIEDIACDLMMVGEGAVEALAVLWKEGRVDICLEVEKIEALWESYSADAIPHTFLVCESISLSLLSILSATTSPYSYLTFSQPFIIRDPIDPCVLYISHSLGAQKVNCAPWVEELRQVLAKDGDHEAFWKGGKGSEVVWLVDTLGGGAKGSPPVPPTALAILADIRLPYTLFLLASSRLISIPLGDVVPITNDSLEMATSPNEPISLLHDADIPSNGYRAIISATQRNALALLEKEGIDASKPVTEVDSTSLRVLGRLAEIYSKGKSDMESLSDNTERRLDTQVLEVKRQLKRLQDVIRTIDDLAVPGSSSGEDLPSLKKRLEVVASKQEDYLERLDRATQVLMNGVNPELSIKEKEWMEELERVKRQVAGDGRSLVGRLNAAYDGFDTLKPALQRLEGMSSPAQTSNGSPAAAITMGRSQIDKLGFALQEESANIGAVVSQLSDLTAKMSRLKMMSGGGSSGGGGGGGRG